jgi:cystathionine beta-lyase/cystathionine gamma-synthase
VRNFTAWSGCGGKLPGHRRRLLRAIDEHRPGLVFLDSLCNAAGLALPDLPCVISRLARSDRPGRLVIDNTGRSATFQPLALAPRAIGVEALKRVLVAAVEGRR